MKYLKITKKHFLEKTLIFIGVIVFISFITIFPEISETLFTFFNK